MKKLVLLFLTLLLAACQPLPRYTNRCPCGEMSAETAFYIAKTAMTQVMARHDGMSMPGDIELQAAYPYAPVASAELVGEDRVLIVFDRGFMEMASDRVGPGGPIAIFAHELTHASDFVNDSYQGRSDHEMELRADAMAGCALAIVGCHLSGFVALLRMFGDGGGTGMNHPATYERVEAAVRGYDECATQ